VSQRWITGPDVPLPRLTQAREFVAYWGDALGMRNWRISVEVGRDLDGATARCGVSFNYDDACIELQPWLLGLGAPPPRDVGAGYSAATDEEAFEATIVHELLHALMRRRDRAAARIREQLPDLLRSAYEQLHADANEEIVDALAWLLVRLRRAPEGGGGTPNPDGG